jgi:hypothetical protein
MFIMEKKNELMILNQKAGWDWVTIYLNEQGRYCGGGNWIR